MSDTDRTLIPDFTMIDLVDRRAHRSRGAWDDAVRTSTGRDVDGLFSSVDYLSALRDGRFEELEKKMRQAAKDLRFEEAMQVRNQIRELKKTSLKI